MLSTVAVKIGYDHLGRRSYSFSRAVPIDSTYKIYSIPEISRDAISTAGYIFLYFPA